MDSDIAAGRIATIILNYNSESDLIASATQLASQVGVNHALIIVDNASRMESVQAIKNWLSNWRPDALIGTEAQVHEWINGNPGAAKLPGRVYFITHHENRGYSAGNNIGIRLADDLGADAVLIANPDMRIEDPLYLSKLSAALFSAPDNYVAASRIIGLEGEDQNPLREPTFLEELFWPRVLLGWRTNYVLPCNGKEAVAVPKVSGCCLMLRMDFLRQTNGLDENVFLYCEEPILAARVRSRGGKILYLPGVTALHAHTASAKDHGSKRMHQFIRSRLYYLSQYSGYGRWRLLILRLAYATLALAHRAKLRLKP